MLHIRLSPSGACLRRSALYLPKLAIALGLASLSILQATSKSACAQTVAASASTPSVGVWAGTNSYSVNDVVSYGGSTYINIAATAPKTTTTPPAAGVNLFDKTAVADNVVIDGTNGSVANIGGFQSSGFINLAGASSFVTNITINIFERYNVAFYDANHSFVSSTNLRGNGLFPAGIPVTVPAGAQFVRFWWQYGSMGTTVDAAVVNTGATLQAVYTSFGSGGTASATTTTTPSAAPTDTSHWSIYNPAPAATTTAPTVSTAALPWAGKKMFVLGDSIVWANTAVASQIASSVGATLSSKGATAPGIDAVPGRAFDAFQNGQGPTGVYLPLSPAVISDVDLMLIALGTNQDSNAGIGSVTDAPSLNGSMSAQMRFMLETIMSWKPGMRIVVVGPYQSSRYNLAAGTDGLLAPWNPGIGMANATSLAVLRNINAAMRAVCGLYGIPYLDMYSESGVNFSTSALWLGDGLHPNTTGYNTFYIPYIAAQLARFVQ